MQRGAALAVAALGIACLFCSAAAQCQASECSPEARADANAEDYEENLLYQRQLVRTAREVALPYADEVSTTPVTQATGNASVVPLLDRVLVHPHNSYMSPGQLSEGAAGGVELVSVGNLSEAAGRALRNAEKAAGVKRNSHGDLDAFLSVIMSTCAMIAGCTVAFLCLRWEYPLMYRNNVLKGLCHIPESEFPAGPLGWIKASWGSSTEDLEPHVGLDAAMLLQFSELGVRILLKICVPLVCVLAPLNYFCGGDKANTDRMSYFSVSAVSDGHPWLFWIYALTVWFVVLNVQSSAYAAQKAFLPRRARWLQQLPEPRSTTVLVEGIPEDCRSDEALFNFFAQTLGEDKVKSAYVVKDTTGLLAALESLRQAKEGIAEAEALRKAGGVRRGWPCCRGAARDYLEYWNEQLREAELQVKAQRAELLERAEEVGGVNMCNGFVTFHERTDAELAKVLEYGTDLEEWVVSTPPDPPMILWGDLKQNTFSQTGQTLLGYGLVAGLYIGYLPIILSITNVCTHISMGPLLDPFWVGLAPTLGLTLMVSFLPTFLIVIFRECFTLKADAWAQHKLQKWYFAFQVVFVLVVTAVGSSVIEFTKTLVEEPYQVFNLLAETMPSATHFYANFLVLQWLTHFMNLLRYVNLTKFLAFRKLYEEEEARAMSEPEDQDYYGLGSRSARWTTTLLIGVIFSTLAPMVAPLCLVDFLICRTVYGYLIPFAETRKPDLGGIFWVTQLEHLFVGCGIYVVVMICVLSGHSANSGPALLAAPALPYVLWSYQRFHTEFNWERLPFPELKAHPAKVAAMPLKYEQPELFDAAVAPLGGDSPATSRH